MHPMRISENLSSGATTSKTVESLQGGVPRDLFISANVLEDESTEDCDWSISSGRNALYHGEGTHTSTNNSIVIISNMNSSGDSKGPFPHPLNNPVTSKDVLKTINDGAASYLSNRNTLGSSTSKIVDQALDVVKSKSSSERHSQYAKKVNDGETSQSSIHSARTSTTATTSSTVSSHSPLSPQVVTQLEPNLIAPSLLKIAKKRRKEPDKNGVERSSFHHTKSSKEYLRKAQEALMKQQELSGSNTSSTSAESVSDRSSESMHSPRTNFRMLSQVSGVDVRTNVASAPFSLCQSTIDVNTGSNTQEDDTPSNPYGYEDPDVVAASKSSHSNPYGYEDPDTNAARILPSARRMEPARRRGSVTKYSVEAAQAAQKATERIMRLQGLNWKGSTGNPTRSIGDLARSTTPAGRRSHPRHAMESTNYAASAAQETNMAQSIMPLPIRRRSIPMENESCNMASNNSFVDPVGTPDDAMEVSNHYGYGSIAKTGDNNNSKPSSDVASSSDPYGHDYHDANATTKGLLSSSMNPYGYGDDDTPSRPLVRRHSRARRRGSVTKFSLDAAKTVASFEPENSAPSTHSKLMGSLKDSQDFVMALKPPAESRAVGLAPKNRLRVGLLTGDYDPENSEGILQHRRNNSSSSDPPSPLMTVPRRSGSARSASSRHLARFGAPGRSDSFLSHGSTASWEDDADSLAPDMESLCSIHDRGDFGMDFAPVPPAPSQSPITTGLTPGSRGKSLSRNFSGTSDNGARRTAPVCQRSFSELKNCPIVTFPIDSDFILPFATSGGDSRSSARMPAPPIRPSHSTSGTSISSH
jgi:hypothetical protein